ncbi:hypothetical protein DPEC_G00362420 [Dallia pectoralis]|nr:hypothetical protein DPEC_G00362420 [Dallia pectoralis]
MHAYLSTALQHQAKASLPQCAVPAPVRYLRIHSGERTDRLSVSWLPGAKEWSGYRVVLYGGPEGSTSILAADQLGMEKREHLFQGLVPGRLYRVESRTKDQDVQSRRETRLHIGDGRADVRYDQHTARLVHKIPIVHVDGVQMEHGHTRDTSTEHKAFCNSEGFKWEYFKVGCFAPALNQINPSHVLSTTESDVVNYKHRKWRWRGEGTEQLLSQPRRVPSPASLPSPTDPALRANPYPGYGSDLPTSLTYIVLTCQRLFTLETCCGYGYGPARDLHPLTRIFKGQRELTGRRRNRDAFQGLGPSLGANPFQGALPFTKKRELSPGLPPASPGSFALPHWTPRGARLRHSGFGDLNPTPFRSTGATEAIAFAHLLGPTDPCSLQSIWCSAHLLDCTVALQSHGVRVDRRDVRQASWQTGHQVACLPIRTHTVVPLDVRGLQDWLL